MIAAYCLTTHSRRSVSHGVFQDPSIVLSRRPVRSRMNTNRTRTVVAGRHGAVASAHPLASQVGLVILRGGGNAVDAIVATAAALNVVEPYMSGVGGAGFLLMHLADGKTRVLNFSGNTPAAATLDRLTPEKKSSGPCAPLIPGNVAGWLEALGKHGSKSAATVFAPAVGLAREGFPLHPFNVRLIGEVLPKLTGDGQRVYGGVPLRVGAILRQPDLAASLELIAQHGAEYFYRGPLARKIAEFVASEGGLLTL